MRCVRFMVWVKNLVIKKYPSILFFISFSLTLSSPLAWASKEEIEVHGPGGSNIPLAFDSSSGAFFLGMPGMLSRAGVGEEGGYLPLKGSDSSLTGTKPASIHAYRVDKVLLVQVDGAKAPLRFELARADLFDAVGSGGSVIPQVESREAAIARVRKAVQGERNRRVQIESVLEGLVGHQSIAEHLGHLSSRTGSSVSGCSISVLGGPSQSELSKIVDAWARAAYPGDPEPTYRQDLAGEMNGEAFGNDAFGAHNGYKGSEHGSALLYWVVNHPDGGIIEFSGIESTKPEVLQALRKILIAGEITIRAEFTLALIDSYVAKKTPFENWPLPLLHAFARADSQSEIKIKLGPGHHIVLTTTAGSELYTGERNGGRRLRSAQDIARANLRFSGDMIQAGLRNLRVPGDFLALVHDGFYPVKAIEAQDHQIMVAAHLNRLREGFSREYLVDFTLDPSVFAVLEAETYEPLEGEDRMHKQLDHWVGDRLREQITKLQKLEVGESYVIKVVAGGSLHRPLMQVFAANGGDPVATLEVGRDRSQGPHALLARAVQHLGPAMDRALIGKTEEKKAAEDLIISELKQAATQPELEGRIPVLYADGSSGSGKTRLWVGVAEGLFDDPSAMEFIEANTVKTMGDFYRKVVMPLRARAGEAGLVVVLDEIPRMGNESTRQDLQDLLLSMIDRRTLPGIPSTYLEPHEITADISKPIKLPPGTVVGLTGNLFTEVLTEGGREIHSNAELTAQYRMTTRHPERFLARYARSFDTALRSRMGQPILFPPNTDAELAQLLEMRFAFLQSDLRTDGVELTLDDSAREFFRGDYVPMEGGRWVENTLLLAVQRPIQSYLSKNLNVRGDLRIHFDPVTRNMSAQVVATGESIHLRTMPRTRSNFHPDSIAESNRMIDLHEAAHTVVRHALYGPGSVAEINTFGGSTGGGWMEKETGVPTQSIYQNTTETIRHVSVSLAGHAAEIVFSGAGPDSGASSDFRTAQMSIQHLIEDGAAFDLAPPAAIRVTDPSGKESLVRSDAQLQKMETQQKAMMDIIAKFTADIVWRNRALIEELALALKSERERSLNKSQIDQLLVGRLRGPSRPQWKRLFGEVAQLSGYDGSRRCGAPFRGRGNPSPK